MPVLLTINSQRAITMEPRFKVLDFIHATSGATRYRIYDGKNRGDANKHGVYDDRADADSVCAKLNAEHKE
ncbi:hypothetical protein HKK52_05995 [Pseudomonas sp. ADAK2]|uniref:hypothetical protein n=1 Tax=unclassified Pseudomonas TaxID=196821 RepID=UPI0014649118|nr:MULTISPECIES: hypothetical protein [unclassified Pseudomonas]QJI40486.1 hypothetical protein HKK53_05990 [Pseudomonas sp. ADAK7]QJI46791.1 hypothetical protein HKK52_05995 [Pseudomonas sp. ADAK2]